jgi:hypothetical protein
VRDHSKKTLERRIWVFVATFALCLGALGCRTVPCRAIDSDTAKPIEGVAVNEVYRSRIWAPLIIVPVLAGGHIKTNNVAHTDESGLARLRIKKARSFEKERSIAFIFKAKGYTPTAIGVSATNLSIVDPHVRAHSLGIDADNFPVTGPAVESNGVIIVPMKRIKVVE